MYIVQDKNGLEVGVQRADDIKYVYDVVDWPGKDQGKALGFKYRTMVVDHVRYNASEFESHRFSSTRLQQLRLDAAKVEFVIVEK